MKKNFFYSKPLFDIEKSFICSNNNYEASLLISFICAILRSNINHKTSSYIQQNSGETSQTIINELDKIKCEEVNEKYVLKFSPTKKQSKILALFDLHLSDIYKMIDSINLVRNNQGNN